MVETELETRVYSEGVKEGTNTPKMVEQPGEAETIVPKPEPKYGSFRRHGTFQSWETIGTIRVSHDARPRLIKLRVGPATERTVYWEPSDDRTAAWAAGTDKPKYCGGEVALAVWPEGMGMARRKYQE